jgi:hypothetical protein
MLLNGKGWWLRDSIPAIPHIYIRPNLLVLDKNKKPELCSYDISNHLNIFSLEISHSSHRTGAGVCLIRNCHFYTGIHE